MYFILIVMKINEVFTIYINTSGPDSSSYAHVVYIKYPKLNANRLTKYNHFSGI